MTYSKGVIYTAGGLQKYVDEAIYSAKTLKKYNPKVGTTLFTTTEGVSSKYFDNIIYQEPVKHPQKYKVENMLKSPYDFTLFLDSDTEIKDNIEELFDFLLNYDLGVTNRVMCRWFAPPKPTEYIDYIDHNHFNGGFFLFKKNAKTEIFVNAWYEKMKLKDDKITGKPIGDQPPLNELFFDKKLPEKIGLKYVILPNKIYNARPWLWKQAKEDGDYKNIKIFHARGLNKPKYKKIFAKIKHRLRKIT